MSAKPKEDPRHKRMREVATYSNQSHYETYSDKTFLDDMLYGIDYTGAGGYERFKQKLREHLG